MMAKGMGALQLLGRLCSLGGLLLLLGPVIGPMAHAAATLPNGAHSLGEGYQDWKLSCKIEEAGKPGARVRCVLTQQALEAGTNRRVLSLRMEADGEQIHGMAVLPFGLDLVQGVTLTNSVQPVGDTYSFSTCLPMGCVVPLSFDDQQWSTLLKSGTAMLTAMSISGRPMNLIFSTRGLAKGISRARSLMQ